MSLCRKNATAAAFVAVAVLTSVLAPAGTAGARTEPGASVKVSAHPGPVGEGALRAVKAALDEPVSKRHAVRPDAATALAAVGRTTSTAVRLPSHPDDSIAVGDMAYAVGISMPAGARTAAGEVDAGGAFVSYDGAAAQTDLVARPLGGAGAQILTVIHGPDAPTTFDYRFELPHGTRLVPTDEGGADVVDASGAAVGSVAPAWAKDATGAAVRTRYVVAGDVLTQVVDHRAGMAYPVVADPAYTRNCGIITCTWYLSVTKTREIARQLGVFPVNVAINLNAGAACAVAGVAGGPVAALFCTVVTAVGVAYVQSVFGAAARSRDCVTLAAGARAPIGRVDSSNRYCSWS